MNTGRRPMIVLLVAACVAWALIGRRGAGAAPADTTSPAASAPRQSNQASKRDRGSARMLVGQACLCHLFVSDAESHWTAREKEVAHERVNTGVRFILDQARRYNIALTFTERAFPDVVCPDAIPTDMFADHTWIEHSARRAGHASVNALLESVRIKDPVLQPLLVVHVNKSATSFNLSYYAGVARSFYGERVVMYANYGHGRPTYAASFAHEILHAFGAGELFFPFDASPERHDRAQKIFPDDIMFRVDRDIDQLSIGAYTAYRIGWLQKLDEQYQVFQD